MRAFVDTGGWIAYFNQKDDYHDPIRSFFEKALQDHSPRLVTSDYFRASSF